MNPWRVCQLEFGLEYFCHPTWTSPSLLRCLKLRKNLHRFPKTVSQLPWIIHRLPCQPFPSELLSTEETVSLKMVGNLFCGSSNLAEAQFLERDISLKFLRQYFCCCCFLFFCKPHKQNSICFHCIWEKAEIPEGDIYLWQPEQIKSKFSAWLNWYRSGSV